MSSAVRSILMTTACLYQAVALATGAYAHAIVINSEPADGRGGPPPHRLLLHFNSRIERTLCSVTLVGPRSGHVLLLHQETTAAPDTLTYSMPVLSPGTYQARWKVMSSDGHLTEGTLTFSVRPP
jgi:methionine-rich copper-binding protein CopC